MTNLLKIESKIEKQNVSLDIFVSVTSIARNLHLPGLKKKKKKLAIKLKTLLFYTSKIEGPILSFWFLDQICICVAQTSKSKNVWESGPYHRGKKYIACWGESKQSEVVAGKFDLFHNVNSGWVLGAGSAATGKFCNLYTHLFLETVFPAIRLTQNFYLQCNMNIFSWKQAI